MTSQSGAFHPSCRDHWCPDNMDQYTAIFSVTSIPVTLTKVDHASSLALLVVEVASVHAQEMATCCTRRPCHYLHCYSDG